jgi:hypothetical protein
LSRSFNDHTDIGEWVVMGTVTQGGNTYIVYNAADSASQLIVDIDVHVSADLLRPPSANVNLTAIAQGSGGFVINGEQAYENSGFSVSSAGDVNGDGLADLIVGAPFENFGAGYRGRSYVVFGKTSGGAVDLSALSSDNSTLGFVMNGQPNPKFDRSGFSVSSAGDVNGDGLADLIVGAPDGFSGTVPFVGLSYVVFGKTSGSALDLSMLTSGSSTAGFVINGQSAGDRSGYSVASAGDVNGDGLADLIIGAPYSGHSTGRSYVVYGKTSGSVVDLSALTSGNSTSGFVINGQSNDWSGASVSSAGDVNGDGLADLIIGAPHDLYAFGRKSESYVIFGKTSGSAVDLSALTSGSGTAGFLINGEDDPHGIGLSVSDAGDVNGDGLADLIVGAAPGWEDRERRSYVVFGKTSGSAVELSALTSGGSSQGFVINGRGRYYSVSSAGDVNGDGLADLIIGAYDGIYYRTGDFYVVYGKASGSAVDLSALTSGASTAGFVIKPEGLSDTYGLAVSSAGDVNGDGFADLIVGVPEKDPAAGEDAGRSYVIFGGAAGVTQWVFDTAAGDAIGTAAAETLTGTSGNNQIVAGAGNDTLIGAGGADVLYGGAGNDVITVNASNVAALTQTGNSQAIMRVDGGSGIDTLKLDGAGITLDLAAINEPVIQNIDIVDLTGSGNNSVTLTLTDVLQLGQANTFNGGTGAAGLGAAVIKQQLMIAGNAGDVVTLSDLASWTAAGTTTYSGQTYTIYNHGTAAGQLLIDTDVVVHA